MENTPQTEQAGAKSASKGRFAAWWERQTGRPMKTSDKIISIVLIVVFLFVFYVVLDANKYQATVHVIEDQGRVGVNPTTERLDFGDLSPGTSAVRRVELANGTFMPMYVVIVETGRISELMDIEDAAFRLAPGETRSIEFLTYMPASAEIDSTMNGRVYVFKIPTFGL